MATEILVNDGGAPARILPFKAKGTITAGDVLEIYLDGTALTVRPLTSAVIPPAGVALTAAADGELVNVISGSGVIVRVIQNADLTTGNIVMWGTAVGEVILHTGTGQANLMIGVLLENVAAGAFVKMLLL